MLSLFITFLLAIHVIVSLLIILIVLMQRPKSEGLGAAFGGGMTENLFGAQTTNVLAGATRWLGGMFFILTLILSVLYAKQTTARSSIQENLLKGPAPIAATSGTSALTGTSALSGTAALTGTAEPFSGADMKLAAPATGGSADALFPAATPAATGTIGR